jgi:DNA-directed RNA polymerase II subunit RPB3
MAKIVEPKVDIIGKQKHLYKFTLSNTNVSVANSIRRTILTDIETVVIDPNNINIIKNDTQFNNEILCQRLACIPVHIKDLSKSIDNLMLEIHVHNDSDYIKEVTTKDFKLKEPKQNKYLNDEIRESIFPKNPVTGDYLLFSRLKPKISNEISGETLHIQATFKLASAKDNGAYNVVCSCAYGYTLDQAKIADAEQQLQDKLEKSNLSAEDVTDKMINFDNHHKKRYYKENSFDFTMESIGVWKNREIISMACDVLLKKLDTISKLNKEQKIDIQQTNIALKNGYDIKLENETYTIGKLIEYVLHYEYLLNKKVLSFVGFLKYHPHDSDSIIRIAFKSDDNTIDYIQDLLSQSISICKNIIASIKSQFK